MEHGFDSRRRYNVMLLRCDKGILLCEAKASVVANNALSRCSRRRYNKKTMLIRRFRLVARTHASHAWNTGSIPVGATELESLGVLFLLTTFAFRNTHCTNFVAQQKFSVGNIVHVRLFPNRNIIFQGLFYP